MAILLIVFASSAQRRWFVTRGCGIGATRRAGVV
jgi:hypothetical protein